MAVVGYRDAAEFIDSIPKESFKKLESGKYLALVDGTGGLTLVREVYGKRHAVEASIISDMIDDLVHRVSLDIKTKKETMH